VLQKSALLVVVGRTYDSNWDEEYVVYEKPCLLSETCEVLLLLDAAPLRKWYQDVVDGSRSESGEEDNPVEYEASVVPANGIFIGFWVEV